MSTWVICRHFPAPAGLETTGFPLWSMSLRIHCISVTLKKEQPLESSCQPRDPGWKNILLRTSSAVNFPHPSSQTAGVVVTWQSAWLPSIFRGNWSRWCILQMKSQDADGTCSDRWLRLLGCWWVILCWSTCCLFDFFTIARRWWFCCSGCWWWKGLGPALLDIYCIFCFLFPLCYANDSEKSN